MHIKITPFDTLFFRDGRPLEANTDAFSKFPPSPETFYGAIRSAIILQQNISLDEFYNSNDSLNEEIGTKNEPGNLLIKGPILMKEGLRYFPLPIDLLYDNEGKSLYELSLKSDLPFFSNSPNIKYLLFNEFPENLEYKQFFISEFDLLNYLNGTTPGISEENNSYFFFKSDFRMGNRLKQSQKIVDEGALFSFEHIQLTENQMLNDKTSIYLKTNSKLLEESGLLRLGGESKAAKYDTIEEIEEICINEETLQSINDSKKFKLYFATPAIFDCGWYSKWMKDGNYQNVKLELIGATVGKYDSFGGWDLVKRCPKDSYRTVPAGSVYYFKITEGTAEDVLKLFNSKNISDFGKDKFGFGLTYIGGLAHV